MLGEDQLHMNKRAGNSNFYQQPSDDHKGYHPSDETNAEDDREDRERMSVNIPVLPSILHLEPSCRSLDFQLCDTIQILVIEATLWWGFLSPSSEDIITDLLMVLEDDEKNVFTGIPFSPMFLTEICSSGMTLSIVTTN